MLPMQFPSLVSMHQTFGNALMERGHEVAMVLPPSLPNFDKFSQGKIKIFSHEVTGHDIIKQTRITKKNGLPKCLENTSRMSSDTWLLECHITVRMQSKTRS